MTEFKVGDKAVFRNQSPNANDPWDGKIVQIMEVRSLRKNFPYVIIPVELADKYDPEYGWSGDAAESELTPVEES